MATEAFSIHRERVRHDRGLRMSTLTAQSPQGAKDRIGERLVRYPHVGALDIQFLHPTEG
jgi:hypothetical protein